MGLTEGVATGATGMRVLVLGGTSFVGRHVVLEALARGHRVTLFNRGRRAPALFPDVEQLRGDRDGALDALRGRTWDMVIDPSGYLPRVVQASTRLLASSIGHYTFVSSVSVYARLEPGSTHEDAALQALSAEQEREADGIEPPPVGSIAAAYGALYGPLKARAEAVVAEALPERHAIVRAGLVVGPYDYSDRFTYWPARLARGGDVLAPGRPERSIRIIDVRDLAEWMVTLGENSRAGVYNAAGADGASMAGLLETCRDVARVPCTLPG
jgi:2'-hydroxyisoflavone reductase